VFSLATIQDKVVVIRGTSNHHPSDTTSGLMGLSKKIKSKAI
jgi:hypothetical protein